ncbi:MAG: taurine dioxygenase, partial [Candidatus Azotimanducaceae bacterium]
MSDIPTHWEVTRLAGALGAEIRGPDISRVTEADIKAIKALLIEHLVIFLPDQSPSQSAHVAFGRHFGALEGHPNLGTDSNTLPEIFELRASQ